ncbi:Pectin lyase fold/virulence factor [Sesbania bispinosa]|nr:Pectin lyase fold/virulence factor [Sesbania bispinosa]
MDRVQEGHGDHLNNNNFKTIDGRGTNVHIVYGACITIQFITNVIIHGVHIHDCKQLGNAMVVAPPLIMDALCLAKVYLERSKSFGTTC